MLSNEAKSTIAASSILVFQVFIGLAIGNVFLINRYRPPGKLQYWHSRDSFKIPSSICNHTSAGSECQPFNADINSNDQSCSCLCPYVRASFVFYEDEWRCLKNSKVRELQDCSDSSFFFGSDSLGRLLALNIGDTIPTNIPTVWHSGWQHCEVNLNSSWYLGCDGSRLRSSQHLSKMRELFSFTGSRVSFTFALQVKSGVRNAQLLQGRIINLGIQCNDFNNHQYHTCMMFKLMGQLKCTVPGSDLQTSTTMVPQATSLTGTPTPTPTPTPTSRIARDSIVTTVSETSTTTSYHQRTSTVSISQPTIDTESSASDAPPTAPESFFTLTKASTFPTLSTQSAILSNAPTRPSSGREQRTDEGSSSLGLITGITVSMATLVVLIIAFLVYRRRYSINKKPRACGKGIKAKKKQDTVMMSPQTNSAFQRDDENEYQVHLNKPQIYASPYMVPQCQAAKDDVRLYAPLDVPEGHNIYGPRNTQEPVYNVLEQPTTDRETHLQNHGPTSLEQPVYNLMEKLSTADEPKGPVNHGTDPVYKVLEDPNLANTEGPGNYGSNFPEGPIYNTLEEPYLDGPYKANYNSEYINEPIYNVLEGESSTVDNYHTRELQDPVYNVLEGPE